jgi:outer membrane receptor for ferrienterochelin and colicins
MGKQFFLIFFLNLIISQCLAQSGGISGYVKNEGQPVSGATIHIVGLNQGTVTNEDGKYIIKNISPGNYEIHISHGGFQNVSKKRTIGNDFVEMNVFLQTKTSELDEIVVTGTMKEIRRSNSAVPIEIITPKLFQKNPTPSLFEAVGMVNGVKPQLNCNVCNTGDIHINGMEGPYTMILIDGMPIVSGLSTVYGLSGIPNSMVERIEIVKGPASSLYGSEAMGGIINVITKNPKTAPLFAADIFGTMWQELSVDASAKFKWKKATSLLGVNYFNYQNPIDHNKDNFTDVTLQNRISIFNKWNFERKHQRTAGIAARYVYEDRWGGEMNYTNKHRGTDEVYGESILTNRFEIFGLYQLPTREKILTQFSYNAHIQDSYYGTTPYMAEQQVGFIQTYWDKKISSKHDILVGASARYTVYDDNTPATSSSDGHKNQPSNTFLPGFFVQDEFSINSKNTLLAGYRYDYDKHHGNVHSPRIAYKYNPAKNHTLRLSFGTGFRIVNLFTEDHAALSGAREVVIKNELKPERSFNGNLNYVLKIPADHFFASVDITGFYSYFTNNILPDFDTDPEKIIYDNLNGHAVSKGVSLNTDFIFHFPLKVLAGVTWMDVYQKEENGRGKLEKTVQVHAPEWSGTFVGTYHFPKNYTVDLSGNWDGPMRLPVLPNDYRPEYSPWFSIINLQGTKKLMNGIEIYGGIKNLFNFIPNDPIMRPFDPFNKVADDPVNNPYGYSFDPNYNYASMQGIRGFLGFRYHLFK